MHGPLMCGEHLDLGVVPLRRFLGRPAARLEMEVGRTAVRARRSTTPASLRAATTATIAMTDGLSRRHHACPATPVAAPR
jgi:hypothetical protein